jgi:trans-aconitate methyltransferase
VATTVIGTLAVLLVVAVGWSLLATYVATGAPPVPCRRDEAADVIELLRQAELPEGPTIVELGCGWGGLACAIADAFPEAKVVGVEVSPLPALIATLRSRNRANLGIVRDDFHRISLADADAVTAYLMIKPMIRLAETLDRELQPGTAVVTLAFWFRARRSHASRDNAALYRWPAS